MPRKVPYLRRKGHAWFAVKKVPRALVAVVGQQVFEVSLKTDRQQEAIRRLPYALGEIQRKIDALAGGERCQTARLEAEHQEARQRPGGWPTAFIAAPEPSPVPSPAQTPEQPTGVATRGLVIADQVDPWLDVEVAVASTKSQHRLAVRELLGFLRSNQARTSDVTYFKARDFRDLHLIEKRGLTQKTANRYISSLSSLWRWLIVNRYLGDEHSDPRRLNPWAGLGVAKKKLRGSKTKKTVGWSPDEMVAILSSEHLTDTLRPLVLIAMYTGARIEEIAQLRAQDVQKDGITGHSYLHIRKSKTEAGIRDVPVHSILRPLIISLVEEARGATAEGWLFPTLKPGGAGREKRSHYASKAFGMMTREKLKLTDERKVFHSFRANAITALQRAGINGQTIGQLVGHANGSVTFGVYSDGLLVQQLSEALEKVTYGSRVDALARQMASAPLPPWTSKPTLKRRDPAKPKGRPRKRLVPR
ncbi:tyrosine-type recombinase/integrase [Geminicoccus harenae]|uniref:tyrosine-type recombinase/integrase n=1 Tax=Geminicoccus harenae TaxID=2498453 RepID=UPI00168B2E2F|nr:tyrosine-type recombinase/integrase [Geminicoccus harenae]